MYEFDKEIEPHLIKMRLDVEPADVWQENEFEPNGKAINDCE